MTGESNEDPGDRTRSIEVSPETYRRFEERREETKNSHVPEMDQSSFLASLLDTQQAAREGYYDDG